MLLAVVLAPRGEAPLGDLSYAVGAVYGVGGSLFLGAVLLYFPRWASVGDFHYVRYTGMFVLLLAGFALFHLSLALGGHGGAVVGWGLVTLVWLIALQGLWAIHRMAPATRKGWHERLVLIAVALGALGALTFLAGMVSNETLLLIAGRCLGVWGMLGLGWLTLMHRLHPWTFRLA